MKETRLSSSDDESSGLSRSDWGEYRRLVLEQLKETAARLGKLEERMNQLIFWMMSGAIGFLLALAAGYAATQWVHK